MNQNFYIHCYIKGWHTNLLEFSGKQCEHLFEQKNSVEKYF